VHLSRTEGADLGVIKQALRELRADPFLQPVADGNGAAQTAPRFEIPARTYPGGCDKYGGWSHEGG